jgi:hypothetical protein
MNMTGALGLTAPENVAMENSRIDSVAATGCAIYRVAAANAVGMSWRISAN